MLIKLKRDQLTKLDSYFLCPKCGYEENLNLLDSEDYHTVLQSVTDFKERLKLSCLSCTQTFSCSKSLVIKKKD